MFPSRCAGTDIPSLQILLAWNLAHTWIVTVFQTLQPVCAMMRTSHCISLVVRTHQPMGITVLDFTTVRLVSWDACFCERALSVSAHLHRGTEGSGAFMNAPFGTLTMSLYTRCVGARIVELLAHGNMFCLPGLKPWTVVFFFSWFRFFKEACVKIRLSKKPNPSIRTGCVLSNTTKSIVSTL